MGVEIPVGFGQWTLPFFLVGDVEPMVITCGFQDDPTLSPTTIANTITNSLLARPSYAASSMPVQYSVGPGEVTVNRTLGTFQGTGTVVRAGTGAMQVLPHNCAVLISKTTARGGRRGRGRMYIPPVAAVEGNVTVTGFLTTAARDSLTLDYETWRQEMVTANLTLHLLHSAPLVGPAVPPDAITGLTCQLQIATQRTRMRP